MDSTSVIAVGKMENFVLGFVEQWNNTTMYPNLQLWYRVIACNLEYWLVLPMLLPQDPCSLSTTALGELFMIHHIENSNGKYLRFSHCMCIHALSPYFSWFCRRSCYTHLLQDESLWIYYSSSSLHEVNCNRLFNWNESTNAVWSWRIY